MALLDKLKDKILAVHTYLGMDKRTIIRKDDRPYLTRYYLFRKPVKWLPSLYLHCFHESDEDQELHNHPWSNSISLILSGSYREEYRDKKGRVQARSVTPGMFNFVSANKFHRVDLETKNVWTLFLSGSKSQDWGFWNRDTDLYVDYQTHEELKLEKARVYYIHKTKKLSELKGSDVPRGLTPEDVAVDA